MRAVWGGDGAFLLELNPPHRLAALRVPQDDRAVLAARRGEGLARAVAAEALHVGLVPRHGAGVVPCVRPVRVLGVVGAARLARAARAARAITALAALAAAIVIAAAISAIATISAALPLLIVVGLRLRHAKHAQERAVRGVPHPHRVIVRCGDEPSTAGTEAYDGHDAAVRGGRRHAAECGAPTCA